MKTKQLIVAASLMLCSCATEFKIVNEDVPTAITAAFKAKYASAPAAEWEVEKEDGRLVYEAEFKLEGKRKEAKFKPDGTFIKEE